jgi:hypothetical protein
VVVVLHSSVALPLCALSDGSIIALVGSILFAFLVIGGSAFLVVGSAFVLLLLFECIGSVFFALRRSISKLTISIYKRATSFSRHASSLLSKLRISISNRISTWFNGLSVFIRSIFDIITSFFSNCRKRGVNGSTDDDTDEDDDNDLEYGTPLSTPPRNYGSTNDIEAVRGKEEDSEVVSKSS